MLRSFASDQSKPMIDMRACAPCRKYVDDFQTCAFSQSYTKKEGMSARVFNNNTVRCAEHKKSVLHLNRNYVYSKDASHFE